ncbi:MAG: hypothetical protein ACE5DI_05470, partial [Candidatus Micrarchaeia archaeon]
KKNTSVAAYEQVPRDANAAKLLAEQFEERFDRCMNEPIPTLRPEKGDDAFSNLVLLAVVIGIGAYVYSRYKKAQSDVDLEE